MHVRIKESIAPGYYTIMFTSHLSQQYVLAYFTGTASSKVFQWLELPQRLNIDLYGKQLIPMKILGDHGPVGMPMGLYHSYTMKP